MISIYDITFYKYDEDGVEVLNEDGSTKVFKLKDNIRFKSLEYLCEDMEDTDVEEVSDDHYEYMVNADE